MNNKIDNFNNLLDKYKLTDPASADTKSRLYTYKKEDLKVILKKTGKYSFIFGTIAALFFYLKKIGIGITVMKTTILITIGSMTLIASLSTGVYYTVKHVSKTDKLQDDNKIQEKKNSTDTDKGIKKDEKKSVIKGDNIQFEYGVVPFSAENVSRQTADLVTNTVLSGIKSQKADSSVSMLDIKKQNIVEKMIVGSIEKLDSGYTITARLVQVKDSKILKIISENADSEGSIPSASRKISERLMK